MASPPLPDHWKALGLDRTADAATIKSTYRKLVLKCHPDKVTDETLKAQKQDEFHKIQQAYETLSDEDRKRTYEAELKLEQLRREKLARTASGDPKATRFDRTGSSRYTTEERKPRTYEDDRKPRTYEEDRYQDTRKYETYDAYPKTSPSARSTREKESSSRTARPSSDRTRSDRNKTRDREDRSNRKFVGPDHSDGSSADDKTLFEEGFRRREEERRREDARREELRREDARREEARREEARREEARREEVRRDDTRRDDTRREERSKSERYVDKEEEARRYMQAKTSRASSRDYESSRSSRREVRPEAPRRSSAMRPSRRESERGMPEIVEWGAPISFKQSTSSPADLHIPTRATPQRSYTGESREHRRTDASPAPSLSRSSTMPTPNTSARRTRVYAEDTIPEYTSPDRDYKPIPAPSSSKKYYYEAGAPGVVPVVLRPDEVPRHVVREPTRRQRSPSPMKTRPPMGVNRPVASPASMASYPPKGRLSRNVSPVRVADVRVAEERGRSSRPLYGERKTSYEPHEVQFAKQFGHDDIRFSTRAHDTEYRKPGLSRTATTAY